MTQLYVVEIKKNANGEFEHNVNWVWDEDPDKARLKGESKYFEILSQAAVSTLAEHAAILFTSEGFPLMHQCYKHESVTEAVEEPTEE